MESDPDALTPAMPQLTPQASTSAVPLEAMTAVLEAFLARVEKAGNQKGGKKRPPLRSVLGRSLTLTQTILQLLHLALSCQQRGAWPTRTVRTTLIQGLGMTKPLLELLSLRCGIP